MSDPSSLRDHIGNYSPLTFLDRFRDLREKEAFDISTYMSKSHWDEIYAPVHRETETAMTPAQISILSDFYWRYADTKMTEREMLEAAVIVGERLGRVKKW